MPGVDGPEGELHEHDYRIEVLVEREQLDERGMVCDLDVLDAALQADPRAARRQEPRPDPSRRRRGGHRRGVRPLGARRELAEALRGTGAETLGVRVYENADAFGGFVDRVA